MPAERPEYVLVRYEKLRHISVQIRDMHREKLHEHGVLELGLVLSGTVELCSEGKLLQVEADSIFLVNPYEPHRLCGCGGPARVLSVWISHNFGREYFAGIANTVFAQQTVTDFSVPAHVQLRQLLLDSADYYFQDTPGSRLECAGTVSRLIAALLQSLPHKLNTDTQKLVCKKRTGRMQRIAVYLDQHYKERISLTQLAEAEGLTPAYMSRVFTELFGVSFQEYLNLLRLEQAIPLVLDPSVYLMDVCMECGFSDTRYLNAVFQKVFGVTASEYRRWHTDEDSAVFISQLQEKRTQFLKNN